MRTEGSQESGRGPLPLGELEARRLLSSYGIRFVPYRRVGSSSNLDQAAEELGFPVVVKALEPKALHKTEAGLVRLDVRTPDELEKAAASLRVARGDHDGPLLVEKFVAGTRELSAGLFRDPQFGPVLTLGVGGILAEALDDVALALVPLSRFKAESLPDLLRARSLFGAVRGLAPIDRAAVAEILLGLSRLALDHPEIVEVDINPLVIPDAPPTVGAASAGVATPGTPVTPVAVDALVLVDPLVRPGSAPIRRGRPGTPAPGLPGTSGSTDPQPPRQHLTPENWRALFSPRAVIVAGASSSPTKWGGSLLVNLVQGGFAGTIYPITARAGTVCGLPAYTTIPEIPGSADLAFAAVPAAELPVVIEQCADRGVKALVAVSAGFSEHSEEGAELERRVAAAAAARGVLQLGPNTVGAQCSRSHVHGLGAVALDVRPGSASLFSQSGNVAIALMLLAHEADLGIGKFVGLGNEALVTSADCLGYFADDPDTQLMLGYIEGVKDGHHFVRAAARAAGRKPVVVLKGGTSEAGSRAAASHTGALAAPDRVFAAAARKAGVIVTTDQDEFIDTAVAFSRLPLPSGKRVAIVCSGGGWGVICADELVRQGLELAEVPSELVDDLDRVLPPLWSRRNPVDLVATVQHDVVSYTLDRLLASPQVDAVVMLGILSMPFMLARVCARAGQAESAAHARFKAEEHDLADTPTALMEKYGKPILAVEFAGTARPSTVDVTRPRLAVFPSPLRACRALAHLAAYASYRTGDESNSVL